MKLTLQEVHLLCALAEAMGWEKEQEHSYRAHDTLPPTYYRVDDLTHGIDVGFQVLRSRPSPGMHYEKGNTHPIWWVSFKPWNPLESMDDAWDVVNTVRPLGAKAWELVLEANRKAPYKTQQEAARGICLAAAKAWDIPTELVR